jgi:hypothetical protein
MEIITEKDEKSKSISNPEIIQGVVGVQLDEKHEVERMLTDLMQKAWGVFKAHYPEGAILSMYASNTPLNDEGGPVMYFTVTSYDRKINASAFNGMLRHYTKDYGLEMEEPYETVADRG